MQGRNAALIRRYLPDYRSPKVQYQAVLDELVDAETEWLDIGCGKRVCVDDALNQGLPRRARRVVGVDLDPALAQHSSIRNVLRCDASALPFRDGAFNLVTSSFVLEHLERPAEVFREIARVCRPGGRFVMVTPNIFNYGMIVAALTPYRFHLWFKKISYYFARGDWTEHEEDMFPTFYRANSMGKLRQLAAQADFRMDRLEPVALAHSFGFIKPLYVASLLFERLIDRPGLQYLKADLLGVFVRSRSQPVLVRAERPTGAESATAAVVTSSLGAPEA
jgi:ubiquinone/menaquinone biosynthesis C-methylase UbiE